MRRFQMFAAEVPGETRVWAFLFLGMTTLLWVVAAPPAIIQAQTGCGSPGTCYGVCCNGVCCPTGQICCNGVCCAGQCIYPSGGTPVCCPLNQFLCNGACCAAAVCCNNQHCGLECDNNNDGLMDECKVCLVNGVLRCRECDTGHDGLKESCLECDHDEVAGLDDCKRCDWNSNGIDDSCYSCDTDGDGVPDECVNSGQGCCVGLKNVGTTFVMVGRVYDKATQCCCPSGAVTNDGPCDTP